MVDEAIATPTSSRPWNSWFRIRVVYFRLLLALTLTIALASFVRDRGQLFSNISFWLFLIPFAVSLWRTQSGLLTAMFLLTVTPALHEQVNALVGATVHAWAYPGVDCCLGFLAAWALRGGYRAVDGVLHRFPSGPLLLFHGWMTLSAAIAAGRNIWQSASEFSLRGLAYNVWLTRGISWHDDYYPLQDPFFYSVAIALIFAVWSLLDQGRERLLLRLVGVVLAGAVANVSFAVWQQATGLGWVNGQWSISANAFWPDLHSFGVFMATALGLGVGLLLTRRVRAVVWIAVVVSACGLYLSGSRSTLLLVLAILTAWALFLTLKLHGPRRAIPLIAVIAVVIAVHLMLAHGYRGISYADFGKLDLSPQALNVALSHRPEIWAAALRMYLAFPFFGLGQGAFYRLSIVPEFSGSEVLIGLGGDGVHNELLRMLVELGPIGIGLAAFAAIPYLRLGRQNFRWVSFYALAGIGIGGVYTNALLVRELLLLLGAFAGSYFWEVQSTALNWRQPSQRTTKAALAVLLALSLAALLEVVLSFNRFPLKNGQLCFQVRPLAKDGWTQGVMRVPVPPTAARAELAVLADRPDLDRRTLELDLSVLSGGGLSLASERFNFAQREFDPRHIQLAIPASPDGKRFLELRPSHCYVPLNLGITYDPRRLGVRVKELRFLTATDVETR
jgi:O-antigen ligase